MAAPSPAEQFSNDRNALQNRITALQESTRLTQVRQAVEDLQTRVNAFPQRVADLRERGYAFEKDLADQAADFFKQWNALSPQLSAQLGEQTATLAASLQSIQAAMAELAGQQPGPPASSLLQGMQSRTESLEAAVTAAERQISGMYESFGGQAGTLAGRLDKLEWMLAQLTEAKFSLLPTESGVAAIKAIWCKQGKQRDDDPSGVLYLTDQRLLFEEKEEVVTKKVLFVATEKQKVQELKWEVPVALLEEIKPSKQGMLKNEDHLDLRFATGAPIQDAHVHIWEDGNLWLQLLNRAKAKDFDSSRAIAIDQDALARLKALPSQCPSCGGNISQVVLRGQTDVKCQYCGFVIHL